MIHFKSEEDFFKSILKEEVQKQSKFSLDDLSKEEKENYYEFAKDFIKQFLFDFPWVVKKERITPIIVDKSLKIIDYSFPSQTKLIDYVYLVVTDEILNAKYNNKKIEDELKDCIKNYKERK